MGYSTLISTGDLARRLDDPRLVIVDCRHDLADVDAGERAYRADHIPGAIFLHLDRDLSGLKTGRNGRHPLPDIGVLAATLGAAGIDATVQVVAYDQGAGVWASRLWWLLHWLGHDAAAVLDGGFERWRAEGRPATNVLTAPRAAKFVPESPTPIASADEIVRHLRDGALLVLDARTPERYRGEVEPIDAIAGHIPGAHNRPHGQNLTQQGVFKSARQLRAEFERVLGAMPPAKVVHQCGSGVTACHNALAMAIAGLPGSRLYPGSWSEWIADPARPIARG